MQYANLGNTDIRISRICLGCMSFGDPTKGMHSWTLGESDTEAIIAHALDAGINFFDTAMGYQGGTSEEYTGRALRNLTARDKYILATKFVPLTNPEISARRHVLGCLDASLKRLGTDYVDLYILHMWDYHTPIEEIMEALHAAKEAGKIRAAGVSNCFAWQLAKANAIAERNGWTPFSSIQGHFNLIFREEEREMLPLCREENISVTPYSSLASGRLSRLPGETTKRLAEDAFAKGKYDATAETDGEIIRRTAEIAANRGTGMTQIALAWLLTKATAPIVGATKPHHINSAAEATGIALTDEEIRYLEEPYRPHALVGVMAQNH